MQRDSTYVELEKQTVFNDISSYRNTNLAQVAWKGSASESFLRLMLTQ